MISEVAVKLCSSFSAQFYVSTAARFIFVCVKVSEVRRLRSAFGRRETSAFDLLTPSVQHLVVDFSCFPKRIEKQTQFDDNRIHSGMFCFALVANPASSIIGSSGSQVATVQ